MIHRITSLTDPRLAPYRYVADPGWLGAHGLFVAEGRLVVDRLLDLPRYDIRSIVVMPAAYEALGERLRAADADVYVCDRDLVHGITGFNFHRGCLALVSRPAPTPLDNLAPAARLVGLEGVGNPDNVGGLFRTAVAFGADGILLDATSGDPWYRKAIRTSMGAVLRLPFVRVDNWPHALDSLRRGGFRVAALTPDATATPITAVTPDVTDQRLVLLVGAEGHGLAAGTLEIADLRLRIPIEPSVDSLNVVVAAGIALYALQRRSDGASASPRT